MDVPVLLWIEVGRVCECALCMWKRNVLFFFFFFGGGGGGGGPRGGFFVFFFAVAPVNSF